MLQLTRRGEKATVSCDLKSAQSLSTVANDPDGYKVVANKYCSCMGK